MVISAHIATNRGHSRPFINDIMQSDIESIPTTHLITTYIEFYPPPPTHSYLVSERLSGHVLSNSPCAADVITNLHVNEYVT